MNPRRSSWLLAPVHAAALFSAAKSFRGNPILGSNALNRAGLHVTRVRLAAAMAAARRRRLEHLLSKKDVADFRREMICRHSVFRSINADPPRMVRCQRA